MVELALDLPCFSFVNEFQPSPTMSHHIVASSLQFLKDGQSSITGAMRDCYMQDCRVTEMWDVGLRDRRYVVFPHT